MKKFFISILLIFAMIFSQVWMVFSMSFLGLGDNYSRKNFSEISFPEWKDFENLKKIFDEKFSKNPTASEYENTCLGDFDICATPFYTEIDQYAIKAIFEKNYENHKDFFEKIFIKNRETEYEFDDEIEKKFQIKSNIPSPIYWNSFNGSMVTDIFSRSFYNNGDISVWWIKTILERKVHQLATQKCYEARLSEIDGDRCYEDKILENFYPTADEFWVESIYNGSREFPIKNFAEIIDYSISENSYKIAYKKENYTLDEAKNYIQNTLGDKYNFEIKDYSDKIDEKNFGEIPKILENLPNDVLVIYVKNPENFFKMLEPSKNLVASEFGVNIWPKVKDFFEKFFEKNIDEIKKELDSEFVILMEDADFVESNFAIISEKLETKAENFWNYKIIANNKKFEEKITKNTEEKYLKNSSDFRFAWQKKSEKMKDVFVFAGDNFFANLIEFENFTKTRRNILKNEELRIAQIYLDSYILAFGKAPENIEELDTIFNLDIFTDTKNFEISENKIVKKTSESALYSQDEINAYVFMREGYSDIWRTALDPMGMTINAENGAIEIDFFMTPAPNFTGTSLAIFEEIFKNATKSEIKIINENATNKGFLTLFFGADLEKIEQKFENETNEIRENLGIHEKISEILTGEFGVILSDIDEKNPGASVIIGKNPQYTLKNYMQIFKDEWLKIDEIPYNNTTIYTQQFGYFIENFYFSENENFFIFSLSEAEIKKLIDEKNLHTGKKISLENNTFFAVNFAEKFLKENIKKFIENISAADSEIFISPLNQYLHREILAFADKKNKNPNEKFEKNFGNIKIYEGNKKFFITDGTKTDEIFVKNYNLDISYDFGKKILENIVAENKKILEDFFFSLHFGDDEIGFKLRISDENLKNISEKSDAKWGFPLGIILSIIVILGSGFNIYRIYFHNKKDPK